MLFNKLVLITENFASGLHDKRRATLIIFVVCLEISIFVIEKCNLEIFDKLIEGGCFDPMLLETDKVLG